MRYNSVIYLVPTENIQDEMLNTFKREGEPRKVFANQFTITRAEFDAAGNQGIRPDFTFRINSVAYKGETMAKVNTVKYHVYRIAEVGDKTTLYLTKRLSDGQN